ncbi:MAG TPA: VTT domain-containing protein [Clostridiaceae bacterium]
MNKLFKSIIFLFWAAILFTFFKYQLYNDGIHKITVFLNIYSQYSVFLFLVIATLRIFTLIPCTVFIIIGGILFSPLEAFILTTIANLLSEIILFFFTKFTVGMNYQNKIINKYPRIYNLIKKNNVQILALGISSPVVPSDIICFFSVLTGISFKKYILTIFLADTPIILLYTFLGISMKYSIYIFGVTLFGVIIVSYFNFKKWKKQIR